MTAAYTSTSIKNSLSNLLPSFLNAQENPDEEMRNILLDSIRDRFHKLTNNINFLPEDNRDETHKIANEIGVSLGIGVQYEPASSIQYRQQEDIIPRTGLLERVQNAWLRIPTLGRHAIGVASAATALVMSGPMSAAATALAYVLTHKELTTPPPQDHIW